MTIATTAALWKTLDTLELIDVRKVGEARQLFQQNADPKSLARQLVHNGWLTPYQVNQLFQHHAQSLVLGSYVLLEPLGEGGMGQVFKARQRPLGRIVALKIVRKDRLRKRDAIKRFLREIQLAAHLTHPNIVTAFDADKVEDTYFYVMEYVNGINLGRRTRQHGPLPVLHACEYMRQAALGLQHAFERHIVHRDIKPSNLLVAPRSHDRPLGTVKILDMGLARLTEDVEEADLTREGSVLGTVDFLSPEQALNSHAADIRSDLYGLGCTFYYILTGQVPFPGGQATEKLLRHRLEEAKAVESIRPDVPSDVGNVVRRLLAKKPEARYQTPSELAEALAECIRGLGGDPPVAMATMEARTQDRFSTPDEVHAAGITPQLNGHKPHLHLPRPGGWMITSLGAIWKKRPPMKLPALPRRGQRMWLSAAGGLLLIAVLGSMLFSFTSSSSPEKAENTESPATAREAWRDLMARNKELRNRPDELRRELLALRQRFPGTEEARMAMEYGIRLPSKLDTLARPEGSDAPPFVSAVFGSARLHNWNPIGAVASFGDGTIAATSDDANIRLWNMSTGEQVKVLSGHRAGVTCLAFTRDGKTLVSGSWDSTVKIWDVATGKERTLQPNRGLVRSVALSAKESVLAVGCQNGEISLYELNTGNPKGVCKGHGGPVLTLAFNRQGQSLLSGSEDKTARRWQWTDGSEKAKLEGFHHAVRSVAVSPDGKTFAVGSGDFVKIYETGSRKELATCRRDHNGWVHAADYIDNRFVIVGYHTGHVRFWDLHDKKEVGETHVVHGGLNDMTLVAGHKRLVVAGNDGTVRLVDTEARKVTGLPPSPRVSLIDFAPDGGQLAGSDGWRTTQLWDVGAGTALGRMQTHQLVIRGLQYSADGSAVSVLGNDTITSWATDSRREKMAWRAGERDVTAVALSSAGDKVAIAQRNGTVSLRDPLGGRLIGTLTGMGAPILSLAFSADAATLFAGDEKGNLVAWQLSDGKRRNVAAHGNAIRHLVVDFEGKHLATAGDDRTVKLWDAEKLDKLLKLADNRDITGLRFAPHGRMLAVAARNKLHLYKVPSGEELRSWDFPGSIEDVAYAPDGRHLATANPNGTSWIIYLPAPLHK